MHGHGQGEVMIRIVIGLFLIAVSGYCEDMSLIVHPVSTKNEEAQKRFNTGLTYLYAYNHDLSFDEFEKASQLDPQLAMAYWGMAIALGQNINSDVTPENELKAYEYVQKALSLPATPVEKAYINALATRYTNNPNEDLVPLRFKYRDAMKKLKEEYPEDLDAACLYAESILCLDPWKYWTWDGKPREGTLEAIEVLEFILSRNPDHVGANHFNIHSWEESPTPERALMSAFRLTHLLPQSGHLLHMPCHIFILCGYYQDAIKTNTKAIKADHEYIEKAGMEGNYPLHYLSHNYKILVRAYMLSEDYENAIGAWKIFNEFLSPYYAENSHLTNYLIVPMEVYLYFHKWKEILGLSKPTDLVPLTYWHYSRATAFIHLGDYESFKNEKALMLETNKKLTNQEYANNPADSVFELSAILLDALEAQYNKNPKHVIELLQKAVEKQDHLNYDEPPPRFITTRIALGKALLEENRPQEAEESFRKGLLDLQRNGRLLFGLHQSLLKQERTWDAFWIEREMKAALEQATQPITLESL